MGILRMLTDRGTEYCGKVESHDYELYLGISGSLKGQNSLIAILSMVIGTIIGELLDLDRRMKNGELALVLELPPGFGRDLQQGNNPKIGVWVDGAMPSRAETVNG